MKLSFHREGDYGILTLSGSMENLTTQELKQRLDMVAETDCPFAIIDLSGVTQLSVSGIGLIFAGKSRLEDKGALTAMVGSQRELNRLVTPQSMGKMVPVCETIERAKIALRSLAFQRRTNKRRRGGI
jgi:anti-anti-sigma factor